MLARGMLGVLLGFSLVQCGWHDCDPDKRCPTYWVHLVPASPDSGTLSVAVDGGDVQSLQFSTPKGAEGLGTWWASLNTYPDYGCLRDGDEVADRTNVDFHLWLSDGSPILIRLNYGDLRVHGVGPLYEVNDTISATVMNTAPSSCTEVVVEQAVGGSLPYPDLVSEDYLRVLRLELDCDFPGEEGRSPSFHVVGEAMFAISADDYVADTDATNTECEP